jgi:hypothetical protein
MNNANFWVIFICFDFVEHKLTMLGPNGSEKLSTTMSM